MTKTKNKLSKFTDTERKLLKFEDEIIELLDQRDDITQSDLQGAAYCIVRKIYEAGKEDKGETTT